MSIERLHKLLNSGKKYIKVNTELLKFMDTEEAVLYSFLIPVYQKCLRNEAYKIFENKVFVLYSVDFVEQRTGLSAFKQRKVLAKLQEKNLLQIKIGQARAKYISVNENVEVLEELLYGKKIHELQKEFVKYLENQITFFKESTQLDFDNKYFINELDLHSNFKELGLGWLTKTELSSHIKDYEKDVVSL